MSTYVVLNTMCHWWRHSVFSDQQEIFYIPLFVSPHFGHIFGHFMAIWIPRLKTEFRRVFEKSLAFNGLKSNLKSTFFKKTCSKHTFYPIFVSKTSNSRKNWILKIPFNPLRAMSTYVVLNTMCHWWRHIVFSVGDMKKFPELKMISRNFSTFLFLFHFISAIFGHFMAIWIPRLKTEFRRIFEKSLPFKVLKSNLKSTFFKKNLL